jgi:predicted phage baseplate assembly protein
MPIQPPNLDDLRYDRVVEELLRRIPAYAPEWTDWNDTDPGVTLIQLFAYLAEQVGYRLNQVPEKNHVELLKLLGVRLQPAFSARTRVAWFLSDPAALAGFTLEAATRLVGKGDTAPMFETDSALDLVPAEPSVLLTTKNPYLWDLRLTDGSNREQAPTDSQLPRQVPAADCRWLTVAWDGKKPPAKEMPLAPIPLLPPSITSVDHPWLWVGLRANLSRDAGFVGITVTLTVQFDDDEQPDAAAEVRCDPITAPGETSPPAIDWLAYYDAQAGTMKAVPGRIDDTTERLTRSGTIKFTVPFSVGPIPAGAFVDLREAVTPEPVDACSDFADNVRSSVTAGGSASATFDPAKLQQLLTSALTAAQAAKKKAVPAVPHPLDPALRDPAKVAAWLRIGPLDTSLASPKLRHLGFNAVAATHAVTVTSELLGKADGKPGQGYRLAHGNVMPDTLEIAIQESLDRAAPLVTWRRVDSLDGASPNDRVFELDAEAGTLTFGDGKRGRIPPLVPGGGAVVAMRYRWGGGLAGEMDVGTLSVSAAQSAGVAGVTNFVAARGGRDAETLDLAKERARKELSTRSRAVTAGDFEWIALQTPAVRVRRAVVVPRRRPLPPIHGKPRAGLDDAFEAAGAVSVVVVPDEPHPAPAVRPPLVELLPTPSFLTAVCKELDKYRLVTTEVYVVPPQYLRVDQVYCKVKPRAGYSRLDLRDRVSGTLATWLDVLRGGDDGLGAPFGGQLHVADLVARVLRTEGVERVLDLRARFSRSKENASPRTGHLLLCPAAAGDFDHVDLAAEETTSIDVSSFTLDTV